MKHYLFLATAIATASLFTGCSNNEYVGDQPEAFNGTDGAIAFSMGKANTTRAGEGTTQLRNNGFYVYGEKYYNGTPETPQKVFDTYKVQYKSSDNDKSASNTKGWEYVGIEWVTNERKNVAGEHATAITQTIKYWDYSADHYTFYAFSANPEDVNSSNPNITVSEKGGTSADPSYTVTIKEDASIGDLYFADKKEVEKNDYAGKGDTPADKAVKLTFRNLASKVRFGFYETVPGYSIQIKKMYKDYDTEVTSGFVAMCPNKKVLQNSKITVKYKPKNDSKYSNHAYVASIDDVADWFLDPIFQHDGDFHNTTLSNTSAAPTWYDNRGDYTFVWPQEDNNTPLKIKVDYTLTSTDGSLETIEVKGATATVPADYVKWAANTAYTYIFKISDNTNGTTGDPGMDDPAGLYPITFDAAVVDMAENTYLTTVSTPSVTVSQNGTNFVDPGAGFVFTKDEDIILKVMLNGTEPETSKCTIHAQFVATYNYNNTAEQNVNNTWGSPLTEYKLPKRTEQTPENGYWVLKVDCKYTEGESPEEKTATTYVIIRVGSAEQEPANQ